MNSRSKACLIVGLLEAVTMKATVSAQPLSPQERLAVQRNGFASMDPKSFPKSRLDDQYQQRFVQYEQRIAKALTRGSLSQDEATSYKYKVERLKTLEFQARKHSFEPERLAHLNKKINLFQAEFLKDERRTPIVKKEAESSNTEEAVTPKSGSAN